MRNSKAWDKVNATKLFTVFLTCVCHHTHIVNAWKFSMSHVLGISSPLLLFAAVINVTWGTRKYLLTFFSLPDYCRWEQMIDVSFYLCATYIKPIKNIESKFCEKYVTYFHVYSTAAAAAIHDGTAEILIVNRMFFCWFPNEWKIKSGDARFFSLRREYCQKYPINSFLFCFAEH